MAKSQPNQVVQLIDEGIPVCGLHWEFVAQLEANTKAVQALAEGSSNAFADLRETVGKNAEQAEHRSREIHGLTCTLVEAITGRRPEPLTTPIAPVSAPPHAGPRLPSSPVVVSLLIIAVLAVIAGLVSLGATIGRDEVRRAVAKGIDAIPAAAATPTPGGPR